MSTSADGALVRAMGPVARELLGEPSEVNRAKKELRFGTRGSLCVSLQKGTWHDHERGKGGGVIDFVETFKNLDREAAIGWLQDRGHIPKPETDKRIVAEYDYFDAAGVLQFQVVRLQPKDFRQRRPDGNGGWVWKMAGAEKVIYRLPAVIAAIEAGEAVYVCEGEKAVHAVESLGLTATCSPGGAMKWRRDYSGPLAGADIIVLPDNDDPGRAHAADVARKLSGVARSVRVLELPGLAPKADVADWIAAGGTREALEALAASVPEFDVAATPEPKAATDHPTVLNGYDLTEDGLGLAFAAGHQDLLRFDHTVGKWFQWTGKAWRQDETKLAFSWCRRTCRQLAKQAKAEGKQLAVLAKAATAAAVERFAQADQSLATTSRIWDSDPFLLGTPGGTIDLRTGQLRTPVPEDYITRLTSVTPSVQPDCPLWISFLEQVTANDRGMIRFLKQWFGYSLTGDTREQALLFAYGPGANGKGVLINTVSRIVGDYSRTAPMDTFVAATGDKHPTDLAMLRGARLVTASETEEGRSWSESRIKSLTGGDAITARFMRMDFFTYQPTFKLSFIGNYKPILKNVDEATRRRFNLAPFLYKPPEKDLQLESKLQKEWPGILRWMIEGCLDWQQNGLIRPEVVTKATAAYFAEQDLVSHWIEDCCDLGPRKSDTSAALFKSWSDYALANGEKPGTTRWFGEALAKFECEAVKHTPTNHTLRGYLGIEVRHVKAKDWTEPDWDG